MYTVIQNYFTEYAAIIKDKNRNIEKLEDTLEKQQDGEEKQ